jgi:hypothetical protein
MIGDHQRPIGNISCPGRGSPEKVLENGRGWFIFAGNKKFEPGGTSI